MHTPLVFPACLHLPFIITTLASRSGNTAVAFVAVGGAAKVATRAWRHQGDSKLSTACSAAASTAAANEQAEGVAYWSKAHPSMPARYLNAIAEEPWRGNIEAPTEHVEPIEIEVDGTVPKELEGTLFRNGDILYTT